MQRSKGTSLKAAQPIRGSQGRNAGLLVLGYLQFSALHRKIQGPVRSTRDCAKSTRKHMAK